MPPFPPLNSKVLITAPGRVNLLGEHVDYNDGIVLPAAIDRCVKLAAAPRTGRIVTLHALDLRQSVSFSLDRLDEKSNTAGAPLPNWALYPAGVAWALEQQGLRLQALEASFSSNVPMGSGLSSSAAVEVGFAVLWQTLGGWQMDRMTLAQLAQQAENRYVGVNCGLMDQFACANGVENHALMFDTRSLAWQPVPLPPGAVIIIADSKMRRSLGNSAYNDRRAACEEAARLLQVRALRDVSVTEFEEHAGRLPAEVRQRARHVVYEIDRVNRAAQFLLEGDAAAFGRLMLEGHASLRDLYQVSIPELDSLVEIAAGLPGCLGARLSGAGFGGCTVNLVQEEAAAGFITGLKEGYARACNQQAEVYLCRASRGAYAETL